MKFILETPNSIFKFFLVKESLQCLLHSCPYPTISILVKFEIPSLPLHQILPWEEIVPFALSVCWSVKTGQTSCSYRSDRHVCLQKPTCDSLSLSPKSVFSSNLSLPHMGLGSKVPPPMAIWGLLCGKLDSKWGFGPPLLGKPPLSLLGFSSMVDLPVRPKL
jgi:hypothetical protein